MRISQTEGAALIRQLAQRNAPHQYYQKTVDLAKFWTSIVDGMGQDELILSYKLRESPEQKKQRLQITHTPTKATCSRSIRNYDRLQSAEGAKKSINYEDANSPQYTALAQRLSIFNGDKDLETFLFDAQKRFIQTDPNAFLLILFDGQRNNQGAFIDKPVPHPEIIPCSEVYDVKFDNGRYYWLCRLQIMSGKNGTNTGTYKRYTLYAPDFVLQFVEQNEFAPAAPKTAQIYLMKIEEKDVVFSLTTYSISSAKQLSSPDYEVPFAPLGFDYNGKWYETIFAPSESHVRQLVNRSSEYELTMALHVFMQKYQYVRPCTHMEKGAGHCDNGIMSLSKQPCSSCKGTGKKIMTTVQDTVTIELPEDRDQFFPIGDMVRYVEMPFEIVNHLKQEITDLQSEIEQDIWGIDLRKTPDGQLTATEVLSRYDTVYVALSRIDAHYGQLWQKCVKLTAKYAEIEEGLSVSYVPRKTYNMETLGELAAAFKELKESGAPYPVLRALELAIMKKQGGVTDEQLIWDAAIERFRVFKSKNDTNIASILSTVPDNDFHRILWAYFDEIFAEIKEEHPEFPKYPPIAGEGQVSQREVVKAKVAQYQLLIPEATAEPATDTIGGKKEDPSLALQRLALASQRAKDTGNTALAKRLDEAMDRLINDIGDSAPAPGPIPSPNDPNAQP